MRIAILYYYNVQFATKITRQTKHKRNKKSMAHTQEKSNQSIKTVSEMHRHWTYETKTLNKLF